MAPDGPDRLGLCRRAALFQTRATSRRRRRRVERRRRPAVGVARPAGQSALQGVHPSRRAGRLSGDARFQRLPAGRRRPLSADHPRWSALERGGGVSAADRRRAAEPDGDLQRARGAHHHREQDGGRRRVFRRPRQAGAKAFTPSAKCWCAAARSSRRNCCCSRASARRTS